jgi:YVTN family beta-propeller protein
LWRIDPATGAVVKRQLPSTFPYHPGLVATGVGAVWVVHGPPGCDPPLNGGQSPDCRGTLLTRIDPTTGKASWTVRLAFDPAGMAVGAGAVWVTDGTADSVARLDPGTGRISATISVGRDPVGVAAAPGAVWVTNSADGTVSRVDPSTNGVVRTIAVGERPTGVAADARGAWVTLAERF